MSRVLVRGVVLLALSGPPSSIRAQDARETLFWKSLVGGRVAQYGFERGAALVNRVEIERIGRQEAAGGPGPFTGQPPGGAFVAAEMGQEADGAGSQGGEETVVHRGEEAGAVERASEDTGGRPAGVAEGGHESQRLPGAIRPRGDQPLAAGAAAGAAGPIGLSPRLSTEHEPGGSNPALSALPPGAPPRDSGPLLLGGRATVF